MTDRVFDDGRYPDHESRGDCFLCGRVVDPLDPNRGAYDEPPAGPSLPIHLPCASNLFATLPEGVVKMKLSYLYRTAIHDMSERQFVNAGLK